MSNKTKTKYIQFDYMFPNESNKEFIFNESINMIDDILYHSIHSFADELSYNNKEDMEKIYELLVHGNKIIIGCGAGYLSNSRIYYLPRGKSEAKYLKPRHGMVIYLQSHDQFYMYHKCNRVNLDDEQDVGYWDVIINCKAKLIKDVKKEEYELDQMENSSSHIYLILQRTSTINLNKIRQKEVTFFIQYNSSIDYELYWPDNVIWANENKKHSIVKEENLINIEEYKQREKTDRIKPNRVDIIKIYRLTTMEQFIMSQKGSEDDNSCYFLGSIVQQNYHINFDKESLI